MRNDQLGMQLSFAGLSTADANRAVVDLRKIVLDGVDGEVEASIAKDDADSQDAGTILVMLFGTPAVVAIAAGIRAYLAKRPAQLDGFMIKTADGTEIIATGAAASKLDGPALVDALNRRHSNR
jgi:hypothetical protein